MKFGFQHLAPYEGHESTLLRFEHDGQTDCVLVDSGDSVDLDGALGDDEYLSAVLVTHAHIDHYRTLGKNVRHQAPVYASPGTAALLEHALAEAEKDNDVGDVDAVVNALTPIEEWTPLVDGLNVEVRPIPAGHAPGAAGFLIRIEDEPLDGPQYVLFTGDFTRRPCANTPGLPLDVPRPPKAAFVNASTAGEFEDGLTESVEKTLESAFAGGRAVVATGGLTGVHFAHVLGHAVSMLGETLPVRVVGQAAKLYDALGYDLPNVVSTQTFERTGEVLGDGGVTVAGPEAPTKGSTGRLFEAVRDDPAALFAQVTTSGAPTPPSSACSTKRFELSNHPTRKTLDEVVEELSPENVVVKHTRHVERYRDRYEKSFVWASRGTERYVLYDDGEWVRPEWMNSKSITQIEMNRYGSVDVPMVVTDGDEWTVSLTRTDFELDAEGLDVSRLRDAFALDPSADEPEERSDSGLRTGRGDASAGSDVDESVSEQDSDFRDAMLGRLDDIEARLNADDHDRVRARVLEGREATLLELLDDVALEDGEIVSVRVETDDSEP